MRKISIILMITLYSLSTLGIEVKQFYCFDKLKSTHFSFVEGAKEKCGKESMSGCCKTKFQSLKVKDTHVAVDGIATPVKDFTNLHLFTPAFKMPQLAIKSLDIANATHAPPLHHGVPIYILHCVYRI